jgi:uncharacterized protein
MSSDTEKLEDHAERAIRVAGALGGSCPQTPSPTYKPAQFFLLTYALTWIPWILAAYYSYQEGMTAYNYLFFFLGGFGPFVSALVLTWRSKNQALERDFLERLVDPRKFSLPYLAFTLLLAPCVSCVSVLISECFGRPASQLTLVPPVLAWVPLIFVGPALEELGWRGYGMDALRSKLGMFSATILFGVLWALWHAPMFVINHTYQHDLWLMSPIYVINFFVGTIPLAVAANWLYYKHNRLILAAILFHCIFDAVAEGLHIEQFTKCIMTGVFLAVALVIVLADRKLFRQGPKTFLAEEAVAKRGGSFSGGRASKNGQSLGLQRSEQLAPRTGRRRRERR